jgi:phage terminase Nu1 subunit (DNA packaging protein)
MKTQSVADAVVTAAVLGRVLGISRASIANLATDGVLPRADRGRFSLSACVQAYFRHKAVTSANADSATKSLVIERSRLARSKADAAEREAQVESGELIPANDVQTAWLAVVGTVRTRVLVVPKKIAPRVILFKSASEAEQLMAKELNAALAALSAQPI